MITYTLAITMALMTWYSGDYTPGYHAAHWHNQTPAGAPAVVDYVYPGLAAPRTIPFGALLRVKRLDTEAVAYGVVVDRMPWFTPEYDMRLDAWPRLAQLLGFGPMFGQDDVGIIPVMVEIATERRQSDRDRRRG